MEDTGKLSVNEVQRNKWRRVWQLIDRQYQHEVFTPQNILCNYQEDGVLQEWWKI